MAKYKAHTVPRNILTIFLFLTSPIWIISVTIFEAIVYIWKEASEISNSFINRRNVYK
jgi:hypothetical protein